MIELHTPTALLAGLTPEQFMREHWHKKPLLVRRAIPGFGPILPRDKLLSLAGREGVESRLVVQLGGGQWRLEHGPLAKKSLPPLAQSGWTVLVQGVDLHNAAARALLERFRFVPDARLDDLMMSFATEGGGVGPHFDQYDVFLIQAAGQRRWRIGRQENMQLQPDVPLKILTHFEPEEEFVLNPGDMLYLPPKWAHDGIAEGGECMTYSVGFRAPKSHELAADILVRLSDAGECEPDPVTLYADPAQPATAAPAHIPADLLDFARAAVEQALSKPRALARALGESLSEPKPHVWFEAPIDEVETLDDARAVRLNARTRMLYDAAHVFINGESFLADGPDAQRMQTLANTRELAQADIAALSPEARELLLEWVNAGWVDLLA